MKKKLILFICLGLLIFTACRQNSESDLGQEKAMGQEESYRSYETDKYELIEEKNLDLSEEEKGLKVSLAYMQVFKCDPKDLEDLPEDIKKDLDLIYMINFSAELTNLSASKKSDFIKGASLVDSQGNESLGIVSYDQGVLRDLKAGQSIPCRITFNLDSYDQNLDQLVIETSDGRIVFDL